MCFFFREAEKSKKKKNTTLFFFFLGKVHRSFIRNFDEFLFFLIKVGCVFFSRNFVFFFHGKCRMAFIHSIFAAEKKNNPGKKNSFFIHSFDIPSKVHKNKLLSVKKNDTFVIILNGALSPPSSCLAQKKFYSKIACSPIFEIPHTADDFYQKKYMAC